MENKIRKIDDIPKDVLSDLRKMKNKIRESAGAKPNFIHTNSGTLRGLGFSVDRSIKDDDIIEGRIAEKEEKN